MRKQRIKVKHLVCSFRQKSHDRVKQRQILYQYSLRKQFLIRTVFEWNVFSCNLVSFQKTGSVQSKKDITIYKDYYQGGNGLDDLQSLFKFSYCDLQFKVIEMFLGARNPKIITLSNFTVFISSLLLMSAKKYLNLITQKTYL